MIGVIVHINGKVLDHMEAVRKRPNGRPRKGTICTYRTGNGKTIRHPYGDRLGLVAKILEAYRGD